jgi:hypothetical protein
LKTISEEFFSALPRIIGGWDAKQKQSVLEK